MMSSASQSHMTMKAYSRRMGIGRRANAYSEMRDLVQPASAAMTPWGRPSSRSRSRNLVIGIVLTGGLGHGRGDPRLGGAARLGDEGVEVGRLLPGGVGPGSQDVVEVLDLLGGGVLGVAQVGAQVGGDGHVGE